MLTSLNFSDYKRIKNPGIIMQELGLVNYLVGGNNSGKTSVLNYIFEINFDKSLYICDSFTELDVINKFDYSLLKNFNIKDNIWQQVFDSYLNNAHIAVLDLVCSEGFYNQCKLFDPVSHKAAQEIVNQNKQLHNNSEIEYGDKVNNIAVSIIDAVQKRDVEIIVIDNPSNKLYPIISKQLPTLFELLSENFGIQIFVATHDPFLISGVARYTDPESQITTNNQRVYFVTDGRITSKTGKISNKGSAGYSGERIIKVATHLLGVGLSDLFASDQFSFASSYKPTVVLCEGEGDDQDAEIYNTIFRNKYPEVLFISGRSATQITNAFNILLEIQPALSLNADLRMVRDRDHEFPRQSDIISFEKENPNCKVLHRRAIEFYIFNPETAQAVLNLFDKKISENHAREFQNLINELQQQTEHGIKGDAYKRLLQEEFLKATRGFALELVKNSNMSLKRRVAALITPSMQTYQELDGIIFGNA